MTSHPGQGKDQPVNAACDLPAELARDIQDLLFITRSMLTTLQSRGGPAITSAIEQSAYLLTGGGTATSLIRDLGRARQQLTALMAATLVHAAESPEPPAGRPATPPVSRRSEPRMTAVPHPFIIQIGWLGPEEGYCAVFVRDGAPWVHGGAIVGTGATPGEATDNLTVTARDLVICGQSPRTTRPLPLPDRVWLYVQLVQIDPRPHPADPQMHAALQRACSQAQRPFPPEPGR